MNADILFSLAAVVIAVTLHELAHGVAAYAMGDTTARDAGRLSLNPLRHVDPVGTLLLPGFLAVSQLATLGRVVFLFGWARPVPVRAENFANPRQQMALVAACGPLMNFLLAYLAALGFHLAPDSPFLAVFLIVNIALGLFNLIPLPPLDGGRIAVGILPLALARAYARLERYGLLIVIVLILFRAQIAAALGLHIDLLGAARLFLRAAGIDPLATTGMGDG